MAECQTCPFSERVKTLEKEMAENKQAHKKFYDEFDRQRVSAAITDERYRTIISTLNELTAKVETLKSKDGKKWDALLQSLITAAGGGIVGYMLSAVLH